MGELVAGLHRALATPSSVIEQPVGTVGPEVVDQWRTEALTRLEEALELTADPELNAWVHGMRAALEALSSVPAATIQPIHGDLHVGQILAWSGGLAVIDFDGNPTLPEPANAVAQPRERDVAQMLMAIDHAGRVVEERGTADGGDRSGWIDATRAGFLDAVGAINETLLAAFEVEQECRELIYAARFLPRWRYAPMATLRARFG